MTLISLKPLFLLGFWMSCKYYITTWCSVLSHTQLQFCTRRMKMAVTWDSFTWLSFLFGGTGIWTQGHVLVRQVVYHLSHTYSPRNINFIVSS
jgi:hypothetical protein